MQENIINDIVHNNEHNTNNDVRADVSLTEQNAIIARQDAENASSKDQFTSEKIAYLQAIHTAVDRMGTTSLAIKGLAVTLFVAAFSFSSFEKDVLCIFSLIAILMFLIMDVYYFQIERKFRTLYDNVKNDKHEINFSLAIAKPISWKSRDSLVSCLRSKSIWMYYGMLATFNFIIFLWGKCICIG